jgi:hypothetical protein
MAPMQLPILLILFGLLLYLPTWGWRGGEIKEIGRIIFFCGMFALALTFKGTRFF